MLPSGKWIDGLDADGSVENAARRSLQARLTAVAHALPFAAHLADHNVEHVHRLRVATRRAIAALELYRDTLPRKPARWLKKRLKKIRRAAGAARDLDVLGDRMLRDYGERAQPMLLLVAERRSSVQKAIVDVAEQCRRDDRFVRKTGKLLDGIESRPANGSEVENFRSWATLQLAAAAKVFFDRAPGNGADTAALHQFRIRAKELRYTIELVVAAFGDDLRNDHYPVVEELQERLGKVQDHVTAIAQLSAWADDSQSAERQEVLRDLAEEERDRLIDSIGDFLIWWTDERAQALRVGLSQSVNEDQPEKCSLAAPQM
jgi:CHAD domain-containing protein